MKILIASLLVLACVLPLPGHTQSFVEHSQVGRTQSGQVGRVLDVRVVEIENREQERNQSRLKRDLARSATRNMDYRYRSLAQTLGEAILQGQARGELGTELIILDAQSGKAFSLVVRGRLSVLPGDNVWISGKGQNTRVVPLR